MTTGYWPRTTYFYWPQTYFFWPETYEYWSDYGLYEASIYRLPIVVEDRAIQIIVSPNGKLPSTATVIYVGRALAQSRVLTLLLHNTHASNTNTAEISIRRRADILNLVFTAEMLAGETVYLSDMAVLNPMDTIHGKATNADQVSYDMSIAERFML